MYIFFSDEEKDLLYLKLLAHGNWCKKLKYRGLEVVWLVGQFWIWIRDWGQGGMRLRY